MNRYGIPALLVGKKHTGMLCKPFSEIQATGRYVCIDQWRKSR